MIVEAEAIIQASRAETWAVITDLENTPKILSGVLQIEVLERPASGLVGLKWRETRMLFGKLAAVDKCITEAVENEFYTVQAQDGGFVFVTTKRLSSSGDGTRLKESHESRPQD